MSHGLVTPGRNLKERAAVAVADTELQGALRNLDIRLHTARAVADRHGDLKDRAAAIRRETLADLDGWLDRLQATLQGLGATVHRCATPAEARRAVLDIARREGVRRVVKAKSMATEEIDLSDALEAAGIETVETDLGEYVVQVAGERPSHIITPVIHKTLRQVAAVLSREAGEPLPADRDALTEWVRRHLRRRFLAADMGITGANFVAADTGTIVVVTNEGNGRFCTSLPRVHVCVMPIEKVVPRFADLATMLPLLTMSATGQRLSNYLSMVTGPRRPGEPDGPEQLHVVFLDNRRRDLLGTPYEEMLACIRCGACLNVCPVYRKVGGHAYDSVYSGPMGKVLTPLLSAGTDGRDLPHASTLCGACTEACPVEIPLADLLVRLRADLRTPGPVTGPDAGVPRASVIAPAAPHERLPGEGFPWPAADASLPTRPGPRGGVRRAGFATWARLWASPSGYRVSTAVARAAGRLGSRQGWLRRAPAPLSGWTASRDLPVPSGPPFRRRWRARGSRDGW
jgi:L-lactate dehydrogenase complex protein LldF